MATDVADLRAEVLELRSRLDTLDKKLASLEEPSSDEAIVNDRPRRQNFGFYKES